MKVLFSFLRECGVTILHEPERYKSPLMVPIDEVIDAIDDMTLTRE